MGKNIKSHMPQNSQSLKGGQWKAVIKLEMRLVLQYKWWDDRTTFKAIYCGTALWQGKSQVLQNGCGSPRTVRAGLVCRTTFAQAQQRIFIIEVQDDESLEKTFSWRCMGKGAILDFLSGRNMTIVILVRCGDLVCRWLWLWPGRSSPYLPVWLRKGSMESMKQGKTGSRKRRNNNYNSEFVHSEYAVQFLFVEKKIQKIQREQNHKISKVGIDL